VGIGGLDGVAWQVGHTSELAASVGQAIGF